nr:uncharacterized protein LOC123745075 [Procambarus clarkii]XP_045581333.1 uncharacterized protein LOC123745075 [Procambarus clarkii]XP_045581334.1 uncharacterized protein LOC123745075 [Procambarus clarkii]
MPGLRSLVARRRSSLASPPYVSSTSNLPLNLSDAYVSDGKGQKSESSSCQTPEEVTANGEEASQDDDGGGGSEGDGGGGGDDGDVNSHSSDNGDCQAPQQTKDSNEVNQTQENTDVENVESDRSNEVSAADNEELNQCHEPGDREINELDKAGNVSNVSCESVNKNNEPTDVEHVENANTQESSNSKHPSVSELSNMSKVNLEEKEKNSENIHVSNEDKQEILCVNADCEKHEEGTTDRDAEKSNEQNVSDANNEKIIDKEGSENKETTNVDHIVNNSNSDINIIDGEEVGVIHPLEKKDDNLNQNNCSNTPNEKEVAPHDENGEASSECLSIADSKNPKLNNDTCVSGKQISNTEQCSKSELLTIKEKFCGGANRFVKKSAMEIESTLASRGVTIVRRMVDNVETVGRIKNETKQATNMAAVVKNGSVITANPQITAPSGNFSSQSNSRLSLANNVFKGFASVSIQSGSSVRHFSEGLMSRSVSKDIYKPINSRGTLVQGGSKALSNLKKCTQLNFRGIPIHPNSKYTPHTNSNLRSLGLNDRGFKLDTTLKGLNLHTTKGFTAHSNPRGPSFQNRLGGTAMQANLRANAMSIDSSGLHGDLNKGSMRYASPRGPTIKPNSTGQSPHSKSTISPHIRPVTSQQSRPVGNMSQVRSLGIPNRSKSVDVSLLSKVTEVSSQPRLEMSPCAKSTTMAPRAPSTTMSPQSRPNVMSPNRPNVMSPQSQSAKMSPQSKSIDVSPQSRTIDLLSQNKSNEVDVSLHSKTGDASPKSRSVGTVLPLQSRSADLSPLSISDQISPQSINKVNHTGIHPHSRYTGMSPQSLMTDLSPQSRSSGLPPHSVSAVHATQSVSTTSTRPSPQMNLMGVSAHSSTIGPLPESNDETIPPHSSSGALLSQTNSLGVPSHMVTTGLPHMVNSDRFSASSSSSGFPVSSGFLGSSSTDQFPAYNNSGEFSPHTNTTEFPSELSSGGFNMHSSSGGFSTQSNLIGFTTQTNSCGFPQHSNSGDYSPHNPGGIIGQTNSEGFSAHSSCGSFPVAMNSGGYPAHSSTGQYNTQNNAGEFRENSTDMMMYSASRDFPMHPNSREFSSYSSSNNMPNNMQNCSQGMPLSSNTGNPSINPIVGDQYSQSNYGESLAHPTYREAPLHSRVSPGEVPVLPDFRESSLRHAYRDSSLPPSYNNYRDPGSQDNSRGSQSHNYRGMPLHSNMGELQAHVNTRAQNSHTSFKEQSEPAGYRGQDILSNYMESSAIPNFRDTLDLGNCTEQPLNNYRQTVNHSSPREQVLPSFGESVTHPSPGDQVIPSPREQMLPPYGEPVGHSSPREQALPGFRESVNHASPRDQVLPCFQETVSHTSPREQVLPCFQETVSHTSPREQVLPAFRVNGRHSSPREQILPSFQETLNDTNSKQPYLPTFREPDNYNTSFRESLNHNSSCELSGNPNSGDLLSYGTSCRHPSNSVQADKPRADNSYRESNTIPNFRINSQHMILEEPSVDLKFREDNLVNTYNESSALPSFTESFEHNGSNEIQIKTESSSVGLSSFRDSSHYSTPRNVSDCGSFRESSFSPNSRSPVYANTRNSCASWHTGELPVYTDTGESPIYLCTNDSSDSQVRESAGICSRRESLVHSSSVYSSAHPDTCEDSNIKTRDSGFISGSRDNFLLDKSLIPSTEESPVHADVGNSPGYSSIMDSVDHGLREAYHESRTETYGHPDTKPSVQSSEDLPQGPRDLPVNSTSINSLDNLSSVEEAKLPNQESSVDVSPNEFCETAVLSSPTSQPLSESPVHSKCITRTSPIDDSAILSPSCSDSLGSPEKHTSGISSTKSDSGASPSSQERIVIKMKLLHSELGSECNRQSRTENAGITELRMDSRNSVKYPMAKYTRWTIDSIINGREDICSEEGSDKVSKNEQKLVHDEINLKEDTTFSLAVSPKRTKRQKISEMCNESRETKLDTNKNLMKKTIRITIANPLRTRVSTTDNCVDIKLKESEHDSTILSCEIIPDEKNENVQPVTVNNVRRSCRLENESANQISMCSTRKLRDRHLKLPSPAPSIESCASSTSASRASCDSRRCSRSSDTSMSSVTSVFSESNDHSIVADMKKCSIVIKRIYATDNYSCYSSSLCDKKPVLNNRDVRPTRPKRKAAVEATLKCHKSLKSLDTNDAKTKLPQNGAFNAGKNCVSVNEENKAPLNNIPQCSVLLYDVFMNRRINKMVCPGCSRHYDSTDSVQVNINKATISLLCSACQWLVVKDVHPREVDSMAPS